uniref:AAA_9 domain-containing protein n=1 Tax=Macrostomum lignano TaxID=282301 RepID=A0A1I8JR69_9PLAT
PEKKLRQNHQLSPNSEVIYDYDDDDDDIQPALIMSEQDEQEQKLHQDEQEQETATTAGEAGGYRSSLKRVLLASYTLLVTDQGYLHQPDVVWETLNNIDNDSTFMNADFRRKPASAAVI